MAVSASAAWAIASAQPSMLFGPRSALERGPDAVDQLGEPACEVDRAALDVVDRQHAPVQPPAGLAHGDAEQDRCRPARQYRPGTPSSLYSLR